MHAASRTSVQRRVDSDARRLARPTGGSGGDLVPSYLSSPGRLAPRSTDDGIFRPIQRPVPSPDPNRRHDAAMPWQSIGLPSPAPTRVPPTGIGRPRPTGAEADWVATPNFPTHPGRRNGSEHALSRAEDILAVDFPKPLSSRSHGNVPPARVGSIQRQAFAVTLIKGNHRSDGLPQQRGSSVLENRARTILAKTPSCQG